VTLDANTVTIPATQPAPPIFGPVSRALNGSVTLVITNTPGLVLTLQNSPDLVNWTILATPTPAVSPYTYTDTMAGAAPTRFYRAYYP